MVTTYIVENENKEVVEYFRSLTDAKSFVVKWFDKGYTVLAIKGPDYGEGFHKYRLSLNANKLTFKREKL
jgi:hypothetical protein